MVCWRLVDRLVHRWSKSKIGPLVARSVSIGDCFQYKWCSVYVVLYKVVFALSLFVLVY